VYPRKIEAGAHRPGNVPAGYVVTPFGYFHPSCVQSIAEDDALLAGQSTTLAKTPSDGQVYQVIVFDDTSFL
jgi:hypothetical protein